jgi:hypothetical protein
MSTPIKSIVFSLLVAVMCTIPISGHTTGYESSFLHDIKLTESWSYRYFKRGYQDSFIFDISVDQFADQKDSSAPDLYAMRALVYVAKGEYARFKTMFSGVGTYSDAEIKSYFKHIKRSLNKSRVQIHHRYDMTIKDERRSVFTYEEGKNTKEFIVVKHLPNNKFTLINPDTDKKFEPVYKNIKLSKR